MLKKLGVFLAATLLFSCGEDPYGKPGRPVDIDAGSDSSFQPSAAGEDDATDSTGDQAGGDESDSQLDGDNQPAPDDELDGGSQPDHDDESPDGADGISDGGCHKHRGHNKNKKCKKHKNNDH